MAPKPPDITNELSPSLSSTTISAAGTAMRMPEIVANILLHLGYDPPRALVGTTMLKKQLRISRINLVQTSLVNKLFNNEANRVIWKQSVTSIWLASQAQTMAGLPDIFLSSLKGTSRSRIKQFATYVRTLSLGIPMPTSCFVEPERDQIRPIDLILYQNTFSGLKFSSVRSLLVSGNPGIGYLYDKEGQIFDMFPHTLVDIHIIGEYLRPSVFEAILTGCVRNLKSIHLELSDEYFNPRMAPDACSLLVEILKQGTDLIATTFPGISGVQENVQEELAMVIARHKKLERIEGFQFPPNTEEIFKQQPQPELFRAAKMMAVFASDISRQKEPSPGSFINHVKDLEFYHLIPNDINIRMYLQDLNTNVKALQLAFAIAQDHPGIRFIKAPRLMGHLKKLRGLEVLQFSMQDEITNDSLGMELCTYLERFFENRYADKPKDIWPRLKRVTLWLRDFRLHDLMMPWVSINWKKDKKGRWAGGRAKGMEPGIPNFGMW